MAKITIRHCKYKIGGKDFSLPPLQSEVNYSRFAPLFQNKNASSKLPLTICHAVFCILSRSSVLSCSLSDFSKDSRAFFVASCAVCNDLLAVVELSLSCVNCALSV